MLKKKILWISGIAVVAAGVLFAGMALGENPLDSVSFPVAELGNCGSKVACKTYCDNAENMEACINFAEKHKLISQEEIEIGKKMIELGATGGPGGCQGMTACDAYCDNIDNIEECVTFGEKHGLIPKHELKEAKQMLKAVRKGIKPPPCKSKSACDEYCSSADHMEECLKFSEAAGMIPKEEIKEARMMLKALKKGLKPLPCNSKQECDVYCHEPENVTRCIDFAEAAGFMSKEDADRSRKTGGRGPGGCKGDQECRDFCDHPDHQMECMKFALEYDLMDEKEARKAKKMIEMGVTGGPGGCNSDHECRDFCGNPDNMETCMEFSVQMGEMTPEEKKEIIRQKKENQEWEKREFRGCGSEEECEDFCGKPENMKECMMMGVEKGEMTKEEANEFIKLKVESQKYDGATGNEFESRKLKVESTTDGEWVDHNDENWDDKSGIQDDGWRDENQYQERHREEYKKPEAEQWQDGSDDSGLIDYDVSEDQWDQPVSSDELESLKVHQVPAQGWSASGGESTTDGNTGEWPVTEDLLIEQMPDQTLPQGDDSWKTYDQVEMPEPVTDATSDVQNYVDTSTSVETIVDTSVDASTDTTMEAPVSTDSTESAPHSFIDEVIKPFARLISAFGF